MLSRFSVTTLNRIAGLGLGLTVGAGIWVLAGLLTGVTLPSGFLLATLAGLLIANRALATANALREAERSAGGARHFDLSHLAN